MPGTQSRWSGAKDLGWQSLRLERVCEVQYDPLQSRRFRHAAVFVRGRDRPPSAWRRDQLEGVLPYELARFSGDR